MMAFKATLSEVRDWVLRLSDQAEVVIPKKTGERQFSFQKIENGEDIQFQQYRPTTLPPVKFMLPAEDELLTFKKGEAGRIQIQEKLDSQRRILAFVRPCDLKGIFLLDKVFSDGIHDAYYLTRRNNTAVIGYACVESCDEKAFCASVESLDHTEGADIMVYPLDGDFLVEALTTKGEDLLSSVDWEITHSAAAKKVGFQVKKPDTFGRELHAPVSALPETVKAHWKSKVWDEHVRRCFSCGTCNLVCPTCYCFDVQDDINLDVISGSRTRSWDACMLPGFAEVAGGHNFRPDPAGRQRHRVKKKFEYLPIRFGHGSSCVGCGRCGRQCTSGIDIFDIIQDLIDEGVRV